MYTDLVKSRDFIQNVCLFRQKAFKDSLWTRDGYV